MKSRWESFIESLDTKGGQLLILLSCFLVSLGSCIFVVVKYGPGAPVAISIVGVLTTFVGALVQMTSPKNPSANTEAK